MMGSLREIWADIGEAAFDDFRAAEVIKRPCSPKREALGCRTEHHRKRADFDRVAIPHLDGVFGAAVYLTADPEAACDLVQETFLRAFRFFHQFEPGTNCRAWLLKILHNTFRNGYRVQQRSRNSVDIDDPPVEAEATLANGVDNDPEGLVLSSLLDHEVSHALARLPEVFRSVVVMIDIEDLTYNEAAKVLACPVGTVRSRLSRARALLERELRPYARTRGLLGERGDPDRNDRQSAPAPPKSFTEV